MFFRNVKAKEEDFKIFGLTQRELDFVLGRTHNHIRRAFLLRRMSETDGVESVIIDADMGPLGVGLQTFASGNASVRMIRELAQKDPDTLDRKRVVSGKSVSVRVDTGGCRIIKLKIH